MPYAVNNGACSTDISSAAAGITPVVVGAAAAAFWATIAEPMVSSLPAAAANSSGCVVRHDIDCSSYD
ncbi:Uncharacterised protein [Mycobacterium tuberculosis]|nr:Uncharacterised protein [Mycobacterium tuberculosis]